MNQPSPEYFTAAEKTAADKLLNVINGAGNTVLISLDVAGMCRAYESLCSAAAIRHGAIQSSKHLQSAQHGY